LNVLTGNLLAYRNSRYIPTVQFVGNYRNLGIAPLEITKLNIAADDTSRRIVFVDKPFHADDIRWTYNSKNGSLYPTITFKEITQGSPGDTIPVPPVPESVPVEPIGTPEWPDFPVINPIPWPTLLGAKTYTWVIDTPAVGGIPGPRMWEARNVARIDCYCVDGTSVAFNIEERGAPETPGTDLMGSDQVAYPAGSSVASFANPTLASNSYLWLDISDVTGAVTKLMVCLTVI
jgi:hypothetical protein